MKRITALFVILVMMLTMLPIGLPVATEAQAAYVGTGSHSIELQKDYALAEGMTETELVLRNKDGGRLEAHMVSVAPDAAVTAKVSYPGYYEEGSSKSTRTAFAQSPVWQTQTTTEQAGKYTAMTGQPVLLAMNADNFKTYSSADFTFGQPSGYLVMEGNVVQTTELTRRPYFAVLKDGSFVIRDTMTDLSDVAEATSGRTYLVKNGKNVADPENSAELGLQPFNSIGLKADGTLVTFQVDGRRTDSVGITELEMADYLIAQGVVTAIILDGGGSATFATQRAGESALVLRNQPSDGSERAIGSTLLFVPNDPSLFFDYFGMQEDSYIYGETDFDLTASWMATYGTEDSLQVDPNGGTLTLNRSEGNSYSYFYAQTALPAGASSYPLCYDPSNAEVLQLRMKLSGFSEAGSNSSFTLNYYKNGSKTQCMNGASYSFAKGTSFDGQYFTLKLPLSEEFRSAEVINGIKLNFYYLQGAGSVVFDYVYIGPETDVPAQDPISIDFLNGSSDQVRYQSEPYCGTNYDLASSWQPTVLTGGAVDGVKVDHSAGLLTLTKTASNQYNYFYGQTKSGLQFRPENAEYLQLRMKLSGFGAAAANTRFTLNYYCNRSSTQQTNGVEYSFGKGFVFEGEYMTLTLPLSAAFRNAEIIRTIKLNFWNLSGTGEVVVDYLYIGPEAGLPEQETLQFGYTSSVGQTVLAQKDSLITEGVTESALMFNDAAASNPVVGYLTTIEPDSNVSFKVSYGGYYTAGSTPESRKAALNTLSWNRTQTTVQAAEYEKATGEKVLFATNGDYFDMANGRPLGLLIMEGNVVQTGDGTNEEPYFAVLQDGSYVIRDCGTPCDDVVEGVSGPYYLVKDGVDVTGKIAPECHPRNAVGLKADGTLVTFVADGRQEGYSMGFTLNDLAQFFLSVGCADALYLDGGGSATYASVHEGTGTLRIRNSPSDGVERTVASTLLLVAEPQTCSHSYQGRRYSCNDDGTHSLTCDLCKAVIREKHVYVSGICDCGATEEQQEYLYFDFSNSSYSRSRYNSKTYGYLNFDTPSSAPWVSASNAGPYNFQVRNINGVVILKVTEDTMKNQTGAVTYGPYLETTKHCGQSVGQTNAPLQFIPSASDVLRLRFKLIGCETVAGAKATVTLHYSYLNAAGKLCSAADISAEYTYSNNTYQVLDLPLTEQFRLAKQICSVGLRFENIKSTSGTVTIDYLYIGPRERMQPDAESLFFDYTDTAADRLRYHAAAYGATNYDQDKSWYATWLPSGKRDAYLIDTDKGTMSLTKTADNPYTYFYIQNDQSMNQLLHFDPSHAEVLQLRLRLSGFGTLSKNSRVALNYYVGESSVQNTNAAVYYFGEGTLGDGQYLTITEPINAAFRSAGEISCIRLLFSELPQTGTVEIDYLYVGPKAELPTPQYTVTFVGADGKTLASQIILEGETASYSGAVPTKASDGTYHYSFRGWDTPLTNISADTTVTAQFNAIAHSYSYSTVDNINHKCSCACGYHRIETHDLAGGSCICGETLREPVMIDSLQIYHSLNLASDISVNYAVPKSALSDFDMETVYLEVETDEYEGNTLTGQSSFKLYPVEEGSYYHFTLTGLSAVRMNNELRAIFYGQKGSQPYYSATDVYSIASYAYSQLNKSTTADELKTLCADLLRYGSAAQTFKDYRTDALADSAMTEEYKAYLSDADSVTFGNHNTESNDLTEPTVKWLGKTLDLNTKVSVMYAVDLSSYTGDRNDLSLRVTYENIAGEQETVTLTELTPYGTGGKYYTFTFDALLAAELRTVLSATVYEGETQVSNTLTYSADTYANGKSGTLFTLCKALFAYADSAKAYFSA